MRNDRPTLANIIIIVRFQIKQEWHESGVRVKECDGQISAFEYKWKAGKVARLPLPFSEAYPDATFQTITPDNYQEFV